MIILISVTVSIILLIVGEIHIHAYTYIYIYIYIYIYVFSKIQAATSIFFCRVKLRLIVKGGLNSRTAFIILVATPRKLKYKS